MNPVLPTSLALMTPLLTGQPPSPGAALQTHREFGITVRAPVCIAVELFGAHGERAWAGKDWDPQFLAPLPARDQEGAVFFFKPHGDQVILGYTTDFDRERGHVRHVFLRGSGSVTVIDIRLAPASAESSKVAVVYERTALHRGAEAEVRRLAEHDAAQASEWEAAIDAYLVSARQAAARSGALAE